MTNANISVIIQARMTSSRLPGKVLLQIMDRPLLSYQLERVRCIKSIKDIVLATTINNDDDRFEKIAIQEGVKLYRGSEHDVLDRYYQAALKYGAVNVMRITADCPLIDPRVCECVVDEFVRSGSDFVETGPTFAEGIDCEVLSFSALEKSWRNAKLNSEREHVTLYINNNSPGLFKKVTLVNNTDDGKYRLTVDEADDFVVVKSIFEHLYRTSKPIFFTDEIKSFLDSHPEIFEVNSHIMRNEGLVKSLKNDGVIEKERS